MRRVARYAMRDAQYAQCNANTRSAEGAASYQPGAAPQVNSNMSASAESATHFVTRDEAALSALMRLFCAFSLGFAQGWYEAAPLALHTRPGSRIAQCITRIA